MSDELVYTSAPRGLRVGSSGFCTVAATSSLGPAWIERLEMLSAAAPPSSNARAATFACTRLTIAGQTRTVLSRVGPAGVDHTGRLNTIAHHLLLADDERPAGGPAWTMRQPGVMRDAWDGEPRVLPEPARLSMQDPALTPANTWQAVTGDAGWAGALADVTLRDPSSIVYVVCPAGVDSLALVDEAIRLLPAARQWNVSFNTQLNDGPPGIPCAWRFVVAGTSAAMHARGRVIDLTKIDARELHTTPFVQIARLGADAPAAQHHESPGRQTAGHKAVPSTAVAVELGQRTPVVDANRTAAIDSIEPDTAATDEHAARGATFWWLAVGLPIAVAALLTITLLLMSAARHRGASGPSMPTQSGHAVALAGGLVR